MSEPLATLIAGIRAGDERAVVDLLQRYEIEVRRFLRFQLSSPSLRRLVDSVDLCQSVFFAFVEDVRRGKHRSLTQDQLKALLMAIARNRLVDVARRQRAQKRGSGRVVNAATDVMGALADQRPGPAEIVERDDAFAAVMEAIAAVDRDVVRRRLNGESWNDLAESEKSSPEAIRKRVARAIDRAAEALRLIQVE